MLLPSFATSSVSVGLPSIAASLDASFASLQWIVIVYLATVTVLVARVGRLGDRWGRRRVLLAGIATFAIGSLLCTIAPTLWMLVAARAVQGAGAAAMIALALAMAGEMSAERSKGKAVGLLASTSAVGTMMGPAIGGWLVGAFGWRALFLVNLPLSLLAIVLIRQRRRQEEGPFPETTRAVTVSSMALLRDPRLRAALAANLIVAAVMMSILVTSPFYLSVVLRLSPASVGLTMAMAPLAASISAFPAGAAVDQRGAGPITRFGLATMIVALPLLALAPERFGLWAFAGASVAVSTGYAAFQTGNVASIMARADSARSGAISGLIGLSRNLGLIAGASATGILFAASSAAGEANAAAYAVANVTRVIFLGAAALTVLALVLTGRPSQLIVRVGWKIARR